MASSTRSGSSASGNTGTGDVNWSDPTNVLGSDDSRATADPGTAQTTKPLIVTGFGFALPAGSLIQGIAVNIERRTGSLLAAADFELKLTKDGTNAVGDDKAVPTAWGETDAVASYGSASDLWGTSWSEAEVEASTFGVMFRATSSTGGAGSVQVDHIEVTVTYTVGATTKIRSMLGVG